VYVEGLRGVDRTDPGTLSAKGYMTEADLRHAAEIARHEETVVLVINGTDGMAGAVSCEPVFDDGQWGIFISALFCREQYRGQGVGSQLMLGCLQLALWRDCSFVCLEVTEQNEFAQDWYWSLGFEPEPRDEHHDRSGVIPLVLGDQSAIWRAKCLLEH